MAKLPPDDSSRDAEILPFRTAAKSANQTSRQRPPDPLDRDDVPPLSNRALLGIALFVLFLVISGVWLMETMRENGIREDCVMQGRKNCAPISTTSRDR